MLESSASRLWPSRRWTPAFAGVTKVWVTPPPRRPAGP